MAKSLNQAFIKAYSKKNSIAASRSAAAASEALDQFISRIDTATVEIPAPHMLNPRPEPRTAATPQVVGSPNRQPAPESLQKASETNAASDVNNVVRDSIASQMLKAGGWQEHPVDAFIGGFPMISAVHAPKTRESAVRPAVAQAEHSGHEVKPDGIEVPMLEPVKAPELSSLDAPALSRSDDIERVVHDFAAQRGLHGDIFRLDRPSYSPDQKAATDPEQVSFNSDSGQQSSTISFPTADDANIDADELESTALEETTRAVEEDLRNARLKVFNPVWEVDSLQWPDICTELLRGRDEHMQRVAKNLVSACQEGLQILAVTSPQGGEGRTTVACCLAMLAGSHGINVAIVDGDIENPTLSYQTNLDVEYDWRSAIEHQMPLEEIAVHSIDDQVTLVPLLHPIGQDEMATDDSRIAMMLHELSASFDLVIVDMGHMDSTRNLVTSLGEQGMISAVATVVDHRTSSPQRIEACLRRIRRSGISSIGLVENFAA